MTSHPFIVGVFVPGIMSVGLLLSLAVLLADALRRLATGRAHERHARLAANRIVAEASEAAGAGPPPADVARRHPLTYLLAAAAFLTFSGYVLVGSTYNFFAMRWILHVTWVWAISVAVATSLAWIGAAALTTAWRWREPPAFAWPILGRTPLGTARARQSVATKAATRA